MDEEKMEQQQAQQESAAPEQPAEDAFEQLIRGQYKDAFDRRVQKILGARLKKLRQENETLQQQAEERELAQLRSAEQLALGREEVAAIYPEYDPVREAEDPRFLPLVQAGVDGRTAYEAVHHQELLRRAMAYAADRATRRTVQAIASGGRVAENGGGSGAVSHADPRKLTSRELADIRRRVMSGEKIRF